MFAGRYFSKRYFAGNYFGEGGNTATEIIIPYGYFEGIAKKRKLLKQKEQDKLDELKRAQEKEAKLKELDSKIKKKSKKNFEISDEINELLNEVEFKEILFDNIILQKQIDEIQAVTLLLDYEDDLIKNLAPIIEQIIRNQEQINDYLKARKST